MKATEILKDQHDEVKALFKEAEDAEEADERRELVDEIIESLKLHTKIEEQIVYPAIRELDTKKAQELIDEAFEEHHVVDLVINEMSESMDVEDERFCAKITVLKELVEHHIEEEEGEMFKLAQKLGAKRLEELGAQLEAMIAEEQPEQAEQMEEGEEARV
jgi:hemerythrin-like domain-containing protein